MRFTIYATIKVEFDVEAPSSYEAKGEADHQLEGLAQANNLDLLPDSTYEWDSKVDTIMSASSRKEQ